MIKSIVWTTTMEIGDNILFYIVNAELQNIKLKIGYRSTNKHAVHQFINIIEKGMTNNV